MPGEHDLGTAHLRRALGPHAIPTRVGQSRVWRGGVGASMRRARAGGQKVGTVGEVAAVNLTTFVGFADLTALTEREWTCSASGCVARAKGLMGGWRGFRRETRRVPGGCVQLLCGGVGWSKRRLVLW